MHTESTLTLLEKRTSELGRLMRQFRDSTCLEFKTLELPREAAARARQAHAKAPSQATQRKTTGKFLLFQ